MDYRNARQEMALLQNRVAADAARGEASSAFFARITRGLGAAVDLLLELPRRRSVQNELRMLSDRELSDIGLTRAEVSHIYDADFAARRQGSRAARSNTAVRVSA